MMNINRFLKNTITLFLILMVIVVYVGSSEQAALSKTTVSDLEEQMEESEKQIERAQEEYSTKNSELATRNMEILELEKDMADVNSTIWDLNLAREQKEGEITVTQQKLDETIAEEEEYYSLAKDRIKIMYEHGSTEYLEVLLESSSTSDFFNRLEYLNKLVEYDQEMLEDIEDIKDKVSEQKEELRLEKLELEDLLDQNNQQLNELEVLEKDKEDEINRIEADRALILEQIALFEEELEEINKRIEELIALYADNDVLFGDGKLSWPVNGYTYISSYFGPRIHPVYGYPSTHTGIDIPASYGTAIHAAASGQVIFADWGNAYGNYILIDHGRDNNGNHIITQYAHCSALLVVEGDIVLRGDTIAKIGSTGWSTGNHLHFGVRVGDEWVDPLKRTER